MSSKNIRKMVTTAILIALAIAFQNLRPLLGGTNLVSTYIISTLVTLCLLVATCMVGLWGGLSIAVITPLIALLQGHAQAPMVPWIMAGNAALVLIYALLAGSTKTEIKVRWLRFMLVGTLAAAIKYLVIAFGQATVMASSKGMALGVAFGAAATAQMQQLITALIAMVVARLVILALPSQIKE